jgi:ABC-type transport system substrate-binding protein
MLKLSNIAIVLALVATGLVSAVALAQPFEILDCDAGTLVGSGAAWDCAAATGGKHTVTVISAPQTLNPITSQDTASGQVIDQAIGSGFYTTFANLNAGVLGTIPQLASVIELNEAGNSVTMTVRSGLKFSDGSDVNLAEDLMYWFHDVTFNPNLPNSLSSVYVCTDGEPFDVQVDGLQVTVTCAEAYRTFGGSAGLVVFSKQMALDLIADQGIPTEPGVNGPRATQEFMGLGIDISQLRGLAPYIMTELVSDQVARYTRNPNFYEVDSNGTQLPYMDEHEMLFYPTNGQNLSLSAFLNGQTEVLGPRASDIAPILGQASAGTGFQVNSDIDNGTAATGTNFVTMNYSDDNTNLAAAIRDVRVRRALALAIDRVAAVNNVNLGLATPQYSPVSISGAGAPYFLGRNNTCDTFIGAGLATADTCQDGVWNTDEGLTVQVTTVPDPTADPRFAEILSCLNDFQGCLDIARQILDDAGVVDTDGDGVRNIPAGFNSVVNNPGGNFVVQITTNAGNTVREAYTQVICDGYNQIGISCSANATAFSTLVTQLLGIGGATWTGGIMIGLTGGDPSGSVNVLQCGEGLYFWHLNCDPTATSGPTAQVSEDAAIEAAFDVGFAATNVEDAQVAFDEMQIKFMQSAPYNMLAITNGLFAVRTDLLCNDGRSARGATSDVAFRVDVDPANAAACTTNVGR